MEKVTLGKEISARRKALGLSLREVGQQVQKEDGNRGISEQYLHDIEKDRRTPSPHVLDQLAKALRVDPHYLAAVAGQPPTDLMSYLREHPECGAAVAGLFARARGIGFTDWDEIEIGPKSKRAAD